MTKIITSAALAAMLCGCGTSLPPGARNSLIYPPDYGTPSAPYQAGATTRPTAGSTGGSTAGQCSNAGLERFAGQVATPQVGSEMLRVSGARTVRWVQPGMAVTMDFSPQRLTVQLAPGNVIERAACG